MEERINNQYYYMLDNMPQFRLFVESMKELSTKEIKAKYGLNTDIISCFALLEMPTSEQADVVIPHQDF